MALRLAYDGTRFDSYARQPGRDTVEGSLLRALAGEGYVEGTFRTGSRTDAGVSALENVCCAGIERGTLRGLVPALQRLLPDGVWVTAAAAVPDGWNPRHAHTRSYRYAAVDRGEALAAMQEAARAFEGRHDMRAFARLEEGRNPERTIRACTVVKEEGLWVLRVVSDGFLWNQVRRMAGAILAVGRGEAAASDVAASLRTGRPHPRFGLAAATGLLLESVQYHGLAWDPQAGRLDPKRVPRIVQEAAVRSALAGHLAGLAPWPAAGPSA